MINLIDYFHENEIDCKHCKSKCPQRGKDENTMGVYVDSVWYEGFQCNNHSAFEPYSNLLICLCKYKDLRITELEKENAELKSQIGV